MSASLILLSDSKYPFASRSTRHNAMSCWILARCKLNGSLNIDGWYLSIWITYQIIEFTRSILKLFSWTQLVLFQFCSVHTLQCTQWRREREREGEWCGDTHVHYVKYLHRKYNEPINSYNMYELFNQIDLISHDSFVRSPHRHIYKRIPKSRWTQRVFILSHFFLLFIRGWFSY